MARSTLGHAPRTVLEELARIQLNEVVLPTTAGRSIQLRCVKVPDELQRILLSRLGLELPQRLGEPRWKDKCSPKLGPKNRSQSSETPI